MGTLRWIASLVSMSMMSGLAAADEPLNTDKVRGFTAPGVGELSGRVTDGTGHPVKNATVHVVTKHGERTITTDGEGRYRTNVDEKATLFIVYGDAKITGSAATTQIIDDQETIEVKEALPPAKFAKPITDSTIIPEYTDAMMDSNAWARAWLLLDISNTGVVTRLKLLNPPGNDLDAIAIRDAFKLKFEPARDRADKPVHSHMLWLFEWPSFWWMKDYHYERRRMPEQAYRVPCRGTGPTHGVYRDCSPANLTAAITNRWIERPRK